VSVLFTSVQEIVNTSIQVKSNILIQFISSA